MSILTGAAASSPSCPLVDLVHAVLEERQVRLVLGLQPLHLIAGQLSHVFLISPVSTKLAQLMREERGQGTKKCLFMRITAFLLYLGHGMSLSRIIVLKHKSPFNCLL